MPVNPTLLKIASQTHAFWYRLTGGLIGGWVGTPVALLTTTGRKSGRKHTTPLQPIMDGDDVVFIASNAGHRVHPQWYLNLKANPEATVQVRHRVRTMRAKEATGAQRERLWKKAVDQYGGYAGYQKTAGRQIPVVVLKEIAE